MPVSLKIQPGQRPRLMAVLNLTPDSFYPGSRFAGVESALKAAERFVEEGADVLDIGAESTRPGSSPISEEEELGRLLPVVREVCKRFRLPVSVDTCKPAVAAAALDAGAAIINDITGLRRPELAGVVARHRAGLILMHMRGTPKTMQDDTHYDDLFGEISKFLGRSVRLAEDSGVAPEAIAVDPGIGFGKTAEQNLALIANLSRFQKLGKAVVLGASRKSFIGKILDLPVEQRLEGSLAAALIGMLQGADVLRVHDVAATLRAVETARAIGQHRED